MKNLPPIGNGKMPPLLPPKDDNEARVAAKRRMAMVAMIGGFVVFVIKLVSDNITLANQTAETYSAAFVAAIVLAYLAYILRIVWPVTWTGEIGENRPSAGSR